MKNDTKTVQIGLRLPVELLQRIQRLSEGEGLNKMLWIKRALADCVSEEERAMEDDAITDYLNLRIDESKLKEFVTFKELPKDIKEARQQKINSIVKGKEK